jgi:hypothetical protein
LLCGKWYSGIIKNISLNTTIINSCVKTNIFNYTSIPSDLLNVKETCNLEGKREKKNEIVTETETKARNLFHEYHIFCDCH